jgi:hypothetical protein
MRISGPASHRVFCSLEKTPCQIGSISHETTYGLSLATGTSRRADRKGRQSETSGADFEQMSNGVHGPGSDIEIGCSSRNLHRSTVCGSLTSVNRHSVCARSTYLLHSVGSFRGTMAPRSPPSRRFPRKADCPASRDTPDDRQSRSCHSILPNRFPRSCRAAPTAGSDRRANAPIWVRSACRLGAILIQVFIRSHVAHFTVGFVFSLFHFLRPLSLFWL